MMIRKLVCLSLLLLLPFGSSAWWGRGHMVVAAFAYLEMDKNQQQEVTNLLKFHPEYERSWKSEYAKYRKKMDLGMFLMMRASVWADEIKRKNHPAYEMRHNNWHYVTYKITFPDKFVTTLPDGSKEPNVVWGIDQAQKQLQNQKLDKAERAIALSWLVHLVGDIHQPLHCGSVFNDTYPKGDLGGNKQYVRPKGKAMKLHGLWDSALGRKNNHRKAMNQAIALREEMANLKFSNDFDPVAWSKDSFDLIISAVHQQGKLETSSEEATAPKVSKKYLQDMKTLAKKQGAKAGTRLAKSIAGLSSQ